MMNKSKLHFISSITTNKSNNKSLECNSATLDKNGSPTRTVGTESESRGAQGAVQEVQDERLSAAF